RPLELARHGQPDRARQRVLERRRDGPDEPHPVAAGRELGDVRHAGHLPGVLPHPPVHARDDHRQVMRRATGVAALACGAAALAAAPPPASAALREYWVAAAPTTWNIVPNE